MKVILVAACSLTFSFAAAVGINLQKVSMRNEAEQHQKQKRRPLYRQPIWCIGMGILIVDAIGDVVFIGLAPQSLLAPLGALSLGFNIILAPIFHPKETVTWRIVGATALIYLGTILTVLHAPESSPTYTLVKIEEFCTTPLFVGYAMACVALQCTLYLHGRRNNSFHIVHYCGIAGCFGGETILFAKSTSELIKNALVSGTYQDWTTSPTPYLFVLGMIGTVIPQVRFLNSGLAKYDALLVVPVYQSFWNAFGITGGLIFFQEHRLMSTNEAFYYGVGIVITLVGVWVLVQERRGRRSEQQQQQQSRGDATITSDDDKHAESMLLAYNDDDGTMRHRRARHNTEELKALM